MDSTDQALLKLLQKDSRAPLKALSAAVGLARSTVQERIRKLEERGIIRRYTIEVDEQDCGFVEAYLWIRTKGANCQEIAPLVVRLSGVVQCRSVAGDRDMIVLAKLPDMTKMASLRAKISNLAGVAAVETHLVLQDWCAMLGRQTLGR